MSVTKAAGFLASGSVAGLKSNGGRDLALVLNTGPEHAAAGVFTSNRVKAAPVIWSQEVLGDGRLRAVILNSGGANACTGPEGLADTHRTAELVADAVGVGAIDVAVCSTGLIGVRLPMGKLTAGITELVPMLSDNGGQAAAHLSRYAADVTSSLRNRFTSQSVCSSQASQSSNSGWLGNSPWVPNSSLVRTRPVPKSSWAKVICCC